MTGPEIPRPTATAVITADVTAPPTGSVLAQSFPVRQPVEDADEVIVQVRASVLRRTRVKLTRLLKVPFPWPEVFLGCATLFLGASLGALTSGTPWARLEHNALVPTGESVVFYVILPILGVANAVAYVCFRHLVPRIASSVAEDVLAELPDPEHTK